MKYSSSQLYAHKTDLILIISMQVFELDWSEEGARVPRIRFKGFQETLRPQESWGNPEREFYGNCADGTTAQV